MKVIGITGGSGSGKSTAARFLASLGYAIIDADKVAHSIDASKEILAAFGPDAIRDGKTYRPYLRQLMITDPKGKLTLEKIMRPKVFDQLHWEFGAIKASGKILAFFDCPILFETNSDVIVQEIICITASNDIRVQRIMARDKVTEESARGLIALQIPEAEKMRRSDYVIVNDGTEQELLGKTIDVLHHIHKDLLINKE